MNAVLIGNYGVGNFGDEALKEYFLGAYPGVEWTVLSAHPGGGELPRLPAGIRSFVGTPWMKTLGAIRRADAVVFGGGTLFTDIESPKACVVWGIHAAAARMFGVPVHLAFQGIGPFRTAAGEWIARRVVRMATTVSVRDDASFARIAGWSKRASVVLAFDPVFALFLAKKRAHRPDNSYVLIPRHNSGKNFLAALESHATNLRHVDVVIALFQPDDPGERKAVEALRRTYPQASVRTIRSVDDLMSLLATASHCVCERFHGALAAAAAGVPLSSVPQAAGDKISTVSARFGRPDGQTQALADIGNGESALREALKR